MVCPMTHKKAVFELLYWRYGRDPDNLNSHIFYLFQKADSENRYRLRLGFLELYDAWLEWKEAPNEETFFMRYGFTRESLNEPQVFEDDA